ncbi:MAG: hypothetical protein ACRD1J_03885, partial [Terriglobia bacterium]
PQDDRLSEFFNKLLEAAERVVSGCGDDVGIHASIELLLNGVTLGALPPGNCHSELWHLPPSLS